ncbi:aspartate dehydrogenase domain-containing protein isoform X2 [Manacus candei]|uniref:aspartate dehydrogenase domain-containing protein isoform X2 n=1 Tax=Manacus candei TaxID=415023 RepID=UPI0022276697|nr:aspartate dehydrogenase domain-containing protein isoform X2 [Manacus candei]
MQPPKKGIRRPPTLQKRVSGVRPLPSQKKRGPRPWRLRGVAALGSWATASWLGSPTALADPETERRLREAATQGGHTLYVPRGALWGCGDIARMDQEGTLAALKVTMTKSPQSFRAQGWLRERVAAAVASGTRTVLYEGPLRPLCPLAPNNVNTMAAAAVAAPGLGFDGVTACLVADPSVPDWHVVEVEVTSVGDKGRCLSVTSIRRNPAGPGAVTGSATLGSFWSSLQACTGHGGCVRLC